MKVLGDCHKHTWLNNTEGGGRGKGGAKSTMVIENFNFVMSQVRKRGEINLKESLICIHHTLFSPSLALIFSFAPLQMSSQKKYF